MRKLFYPRRSLLVASTLLLVASSLFRHTPNDDNAYVVFRYYSNASLTTQVGECRYNINCFQGYYSCWGTQTAHGTAQVISYC
jgi:hypothetical protein